MAERLPAPSEVNNLRVHLCALVACFAAVIIGYDAGFIGGTVVLPEFIREFGLDEMSPSEQKNVRANIISLFHVGAFFGSYLIYPIGVFLGRIWGLKLAGVMITVGSLIQLLANSKRGLTALLVGRCFSGVGIGAVSNIAPMYVSEIAPPSIRGRLVGMYEIAWQVGGIVGFFINYICEQLIQGNAQWLVPVGVQSAPAIAFLFGVFFIPESPRWLYTMGNKEKATESICYLRNMHSGSDYINKELAAMEEEAFERKIVLDSEFLGPFKLLFGKRNLFRRLCLTSLLFVFQNTSGVNAINYYSVSILKTLGVNSTSAGLLSTGVFGIIKGACCFVWAFFIIDQYGRKVPLAIFASICIISLFYLGAYIEVSHPTDPLKESSGWGIKSALAFFYIWTVGYAFSWSGLPWVYISEVFDAKVRNLAQCFNASANWLLAFIFARFTQQMIDAMSYGVFFFFGATLLISTTAFLLAYPETKDIPITDIDLLFDKETVPWRAHARALSILRERESAALNLVEVSSEDNGKITLDAQEFPRNDESSSDLIQVLPQDNVKVSLEEREFAR